VTFEVVPKVLSSIDIVEIRCPIGCDEGCEPLEGLNWRCCGCGMEFKTKYDEEK